MNHTPEVIQGAHFTPSDRIQAIRWADAAASRGIRAEFYTGHDALPETFEVWGATDEDDANPITAAAEVEWMVWRDFVGFRVTDGIARPEHSFPTMAAALEELAALLAA